MSNPGGIVMVRAAELCCAIRWAFPDFPKAYILLVFWAVSGADGERRMSGILELGVDSRGLAGWLAGWLAGGLAGWPESGADCVTRWPRPGRPPPGAGVISYFLAMTRRAV